MPLYIADPQTSEMAEELSKLLGTTKTNAVRKALQDELTRIKRQATMEQRRAELLEVTSESAKILQSNKLPPEEMDAWLYDDNGLPR